MGSTIRPGPRGLNAKFLEMEAPIRKLLMDLFSGPTPYNEENPTMPMGPEAPNNLLSGATGIGPAPTGINAKLLEAEAGPRNMIAQLFSGMGGLPSMPAPRAAAPPVRQRDRGIGMMPPDTRGMELPEVHNPAMAAMTGGLPPEVLALSENLANTPRPSPVIPSAPRMAAGPPISPVGRRSAPPAILPRANPLQAPINEPNALSEPEPPFDLASVLNPESGAVNRIPEVFSPEPYDGPEESSEPIMADDEMAGEDIFSQPATDEYLDVLRNRPRHEDHSGSRARNIISGIFKGLFGGDFGIGDAPHQKALRRWSDENTGLKEASVIEQSGLKEKRLRLSDVMRDQRARQTYELKVRQELNDFEQFKQRLEFMKDKAEKDRLIATKKAETYAKIGEWRKEYQTARLDIDRQRVGLERERVGIARDRSKNAGNKPVDPRVQEEIRKGAVRRVRNDPRFGKWYLPENDEFNDRLARTGSGKIKYNSDGTPKVLEKMPPEVKKMIEEAIVREQEAIANRTRNSYTRRGFVSPFDTSDDLNFDFEDIFDEH